MRGKKPTLAQKKFLKGKRLNPANWLVVYDNRVCMTIIHRESQNKKVIWKDYNVDNSHNGNVQKN